jgi:hypothetical protein
MEFVALAYYRMAFCYELLLNNEKALAALTDALRLQAYLPLEVAKAEIPARIASVYSRMNQTLLADKYTRQAEEGFKQVRAMKRNFDNEALSRTLLRMGEIPLNQLDEESFRQNVETLMRNQRYLIQAIELKHPSLAMKAERSLVSTYAKLWSFIENFKLPETLDRDADLVTEAGKRSDFLSLYLESIERLKTFEAPIDSSAQADTVAVYREIETLRIKALALLNQELLKKPWPMPDKDRHPANNQSRKFKETTSDIHLETPSRPDYIPITLPKKRLK